MAFEYVNRRGDTYYLQQGKTKTGKPRYYFGRTMKATPLDALPEGYEVYESPETGQVYARKARATEISPMERKLVEEAIVRLAGLKYWVVDLEPRAIVIYLVGMDDWELKGLTETLGLPPSMGAKLQDTIALRSQYMKMMRFDLVDADERLYTARRWCFRGSIDDWFPLLSPPSPLPEVVDKYVPHLGKESFYELM